MVGGMTQDRIPVWACGRLQIQLLVLQDGMIKYLTQVQENRGQSVLTNKNLI